MSWNHGKTERIRKLHVRLIQRAIEAGEYPNPEIIGAAADRVLAELLAGRAERRSRRDAMQAD